MVKKQDDFLDTEAMKLGFKQMLDEVELQLTCGDHSASILAVLNDRKTHITKRLEEL